ncbi:tetratricopeptide repeat protein [Texcoconibacillus texcoconensis]|uniref:Tetratricopeptide (TPR) repeat protein n=1 Tax=Texcoconibacillus texcoconensis TaxID=1095777 RepID=A0A840QMS5_9BACI|nr:tetratricopeptide repeat protein [Texcoconibacillus texcoconensis]MBB5172658.1 tetratricopeptide (TPR) repeat protein [Texcoconibacillus texcoconensis]
MGKEPKECRDNVVLFPGLANRLVEKGMTSLKEKKHLEALHYFQQAVELEQEHPQARYGIVICFIEMKRLEEAREHCERLLKEGIGQYFEVLQVYVSLLVQLGEYQDVVDVLEPVVQEEKPPPDMAESLYQLLDFSRHMVKPDQEEHFKDLDVGEDWTNTKEWLKFLQKGNKDQQWGAIQQLGPKMDEEVLDAYRTFLKTEDNDPALKSYLLQLLKENEVTETFYIAKFGRTYSLIPNELESVFHERFGERVLAILHDTLAHENPTLYEMAEQLWWHYLFAIFPQSPEPDEESVWAAALHALTSRLLGGEDEADEIAMIYEANDEKVAEAMAKIVAIENHVFHPTLDHT